MASATDNTVFPSTTFDSDPEFRSNAPSSGLKVDISPGITLYTDRGFGRNATRLTPKVYSDFVKKDGDKILFLVGGQWTELHEKDGYYQVNYPLESIDHGNALIDAMAHLRVKFMLRVGKNTLMLFGGTTHNINDEVDMWYTVYLIYFTDLDKNVKYSFRLP